MYVAVRSSGSGSRDLCRFAQQRLERGQLANAQARQLLQLARETPQGRGRLEGAQLLENRDQAEIDAVRLARLGMTLLLQGGEDRLRLIPRLGHYPKQLFARIGPPHASLFYLQVPCWTVAQ